MLSFFDGGYELGVDGIGDGFFDRQVQRDFIIVTVADSDVLHLSFQN